MDTRAEGRGHVHVSGAERVAFEPRLWPLPSSVLRHDKSINKSSYERISPRERERDLRKFSNETPREFYSFAKGERIGEYFPRYGSQSEPRNSIIFVVFEDVRGDLVNKNSLTQRGCRNVTIICLFNERNRKEVEERKDLR